MFVGGVCLRSRKIFSALFSRNNFFTAVPRGVRSAECGVRSAECGVRSAECGVRSAECGVRSLKINRNKTEEE